MDYKKIIGYGKKKKAKKEQPKSKVNKVLESIKEEFGYKATIKEGPAYEYSKYLKNIEKAENLQAKAVNNFAKVLEKKGFKNEARNVAHEYMNNMRKFHDYLKELVDKLI
jgi:hypothetical protein